MSGRAGLSAAADLPEDRPEAFLVAGAALGAGAGLGVRTAFLGFATTFLTALGFAGAFLGFGAAFLGAAATFALALGFFEGFAAGFFFDLAITQLRLICKKCLQK
jgi:hypothetical protein